MNLETFRIEVDLTPGGNKELFKSVSDLDKWISKEIEFWGWGDDLRQKDGTAWQVTRGIRSHLTQLQNFLNNIKNSIAPNEQEFDRRINEITSFLRDRYKKKELLHSSTGIAQFIAETAKADESLAAYILKAATESKNPQSLNASRGDLAYALYEWNIKDKAKSEKAALKSLTERVSEHLNESKGKLDELIKEHENNKKQHLEQLETQKMEAQTLRQSKEEEINKLLEETKKKFNEFEEFYKNKLALHSAISYWEKKAEFHNVWAIAYTCVVVILFAVVGWMIWGALKDFVGDDTIQTVQLWKLGFLGILATIGVWALRLIVRLLLSNLHLGNDARERKTMLLTYLAMRRDKDLPHDDDTVSLILQALFRPSSSGIVKDDATPPFMAEWLKRTTGHD